MPAESIKVAGDRRKRTGRVRYKKKNCEGEKERREETHHEGELLKPSTGRERVRGQDRGGSEADRRKVRLRRRGVKLQYESTKKLDLLLG